MSLTNFIKRKDVKEIFNEEFSKPIIKYKKEMLIGKETENPTIVGTAFDYVARFAIEYLNKDKNVITNMWIAEKYVEKSVLSRRDKIDLGNIIINVKHLKAEYLLTGEMTTELIAGAILLAKIDLMHRAPRSGVVIYTEISEADVMKIFKLYNKFMEFDWRAKNVVYLNPSFDNILTSVGLADADVIIDDTLIEIKTVTQTGMSRQTFDQLMGYYLLSEVGGINKDKHQNKINKIAVYSARYGDFIIIDLRDVFDKGRLSEIIKQIELI